MEPQQATATPEPQSPPTATSDDKGSPDSSPEMDFDHDAADLTLPLAPCWAVNDSHSPPPSPSRLNQTLSVPTSPLGALSLNNTASSICSLQGSLNASLSPPPSPCGLPLTLENLPPELLLHILWYLEPKFIVFTLGRVSKFFHALVSEPITWKIRMGKRWPRGQQYPPMEVPDDFNWQQACMEREETDRLWSDPKENIHHFTLDGHFATVDAVHLIQNGTMCVSGSRDRTAKIWDLSKLTPGEPVPYDAVVKSLEQHRGWVWCLSSLDNILCTGSWDTAIKLWDLNANCQLIMSVKERSAILCTQILQDILVAGSYDKRISVYDIRADYQPITTLRQHQKPVLCVAADEDYIISCSEDKTVKVWDRRACQVYKSIQLEKFCMSMWYGRGMLLLGDRRGQVHMYSTGDGGFEEMETIEAHGNKVTGVHYTLGGLYTCSTDKTIKVHEPCSQPAAICTLAETKGEVADICVQAGVVASAHSDFSVGIWRPAM
ncbi:F-box/WD repeat-containing protein 9-like [Branchiostoma floridae]|uniref:F-box/WD repeat-containing protein 9-like n=1 Tax=Branchiostoma floridae TaxID=7739 RepID=A0A9J7HI74_BRAFL|nr:F-box/WD repeat-containing protein 9-like [Branchiostoma floridae]